MMIQLAQAVSVKAPDGQFQTVPAGAFVNYSCKRHPETGHWIHKFTCFGKDRRMILECMEAGEDRPKWL